jgi:peptide deformylase
MIRKILQTKDPILRKKAQEVPVLNNKISGIIKDLKDTLVIQKEPEGVGLAAPQIGKNLQIFVINYKSVKRVVINPKILNIEKSTKKAGKKEILEGCLSLPNYYSPLRRASGVTLKYLNEKGAEVTEKFKGFYAQIVLHEIDHLNGILFVDRLLEQKKPLYKLSGKDWEEVELI